MKRLGTGERKRGSMTRNILTKKDTQIFRQGRQDLRRFS